MASNGYNIYRDGAKRLVFMVSNRTFPKEYVSQEFPKGFPDRNSATMDGNLNVFFDYFGFDRCARENKRLVINADRNTLEREIEYVKERLETEDVSCLAVILSSHGAEKLIPGTLRSPAQREHFIICSDGKAYRTLDIIEQFQTNKNIPVIYIIQACRSGMSEQPADKVDVGVTFELVDADTDDETEGTVTTIPPANTSDSSRYAFNPLLPSTSTDILKAFMQSAYSCPKSSCTRAKSLIPACAPHTCVLFASADGKESYIDDGNWLLSGLSSAVENMDEKKEETEISLFDLFLRVNHEISNLKTKHNKDERKNGLKSASSFLHQMPMKLILKLQKQEDNM